MKNVKGEIKIHYHNEEQREKILKLVAKLGVCYEIKGD